MGKVAISKMEDSREVVAALVNMAYRYTRFATKKQGTRIMELALESTDEPTASLTPLA